MRLIKKIIVHCSASDNPKQASLESIKMFHTMPQWMKCTWGKYRNVPCRGWDDIGYHYVIEDSGESRKGRPVERPGAHCYGHNKDSIGICLTGDQEFNIRQKESLKSEVKKLLKKFNLSEADVYPHNYFDENKTCPNFDVGKVIKGVLNDEAK